MFPTMHSLAVSPVSLWAAGMTCNPPAPLAATEQMLQYADTLLMGMGAVLAVVAIARGYARLAPRDVITGSGPVPAMIAPEVLFLPMLVYLATMFAAQALLSRWVQPLVPAGKNAGPPLDLAALLANNLALLAGGTTCWVLGRRVVQRAGDALVLRRGAVGADVAAGVAGALVAIALCQGLLYVTCQVILTFSPDYVFPEHGVIDVLRDPARPVWLPGVLWVGVVAVTPAAEELFFRGLLQTALQRALRSPWTAILASGGLFGLAHSSQPQVVPALALFGVILGILYWRTGALAAPIVAHALFNAKTLLWEALRPM